MDTIELRSELYKLVYNLYYSVIIVNGLFCSIVVTPEAFHDCLSFTSSTRSSMFFNERIFKGPEFVGCN